MQCQRRDQPTSVPCLGLGGSLLGAIDGARIANALATHLPYPAVGGLAGDSGRLEGNSSRLLVDDQPIPGEMVLIGLPATYAFTISTSHGGHPIGAHHDGPTGGLLIDTKLKASLALQMGLAVAALQ